MSTSVGAAVAQSIMMQLGSFQFCIATAAYQDLTRRTESKWASQDRFGQLPALQYTGPAGDSMTLAGVIYPDFTGSAFTISKMRTLAGRGVPLPLISGAGSTLGRWCIESVEEKQSVFAAAGSPRKQEFTLQLRLFDTRQAELTGIAAAVSAAASGVPSTAVSSATAPTTVLGKVQAAVGGFAANAAKAASTAVSTVTSAMNSVRAVADEVGAVVGPVISAVQTGVSTARALQDTVNTLKSNVKNIGSLSDLQTAITSVSSAASAASMAGALASKAAGALSISLPDTSVSPATIAVLKDCQATCGRAAVAATSIYSQGSSLANDAKKLFAND